MSMLFVKRALFSPRDSCVPNQDENKQTIHSRSWVGGSELAGGASCIKWLWTSEQVRVFRRVPSGKSQSIFPYEV